MTEFNDQIEAEITAKGLNAPRLNPDYIKSCIASEQYLMPTGTKLMICVLTLKNGFHVTGESAPASPENFDEANGRKIARANAEAKIWPLEGYQLRTALSLRDAPARSLEQQATDLVKHDTPTDPVPDDELGVSVPDDKADAWYANNLGCDRTMGQAKREADFDIEKRGVSEIDRGEI